MESRLDYRPWDELMPEILGLIFKRLPLDEILNVFPSVCKSWAKAIRGPYCWQEIDIEQWSRVHRPDCVERMLILLIGRSCGSLQTLSVYGLGTEFGLSLISDNANNLRDLRLPGSRVSNSMVEQIAGKLSSLTSLDLSYCNKIDALAIEAIGKHCRQLTHFQRNMHFHYISLGISEDVQAFAIADTMPKLKHLELNYMIITTEGVLRILASCSELEVLEITGCWDVKLDEVFILYPSMLKAVRRLVDEDADIPAYDWPYDCEDDDANITYDWDCADIVSFGEDVDANIPGDSYYGSPLLFLDWPGFTDVIDGDETNDEADVSDDL